MKKNGLIFLVLIFTYSQIYAKVIIINSVKDDIKLDNCITYYEDKTNGLNIEDIQSIYFEKHIKNPYEINLGHSKSTYWFKFKILNQTDDKLYYILGIENSNLDDVDIYEFRDDILTKKILTGESRHKNTRDIPHRHFLFRSQLQSNIEYTYYIKVNNNGDELSIPFIFEKTEPYFTKDEKQLWILGLYNGLFFMIFVFTMYLYIRLKESIYLYYSLYVALSTLFVLGGDGLLSFIMPPYLAVRIKLTFLHISMLFLIMFTQAFYKSSNEENFYYPWYFNFLKIISVIGAILTYLPYPYRLSSIYIATVVAPVIFITVVLISIILYKKEYYTSFYTVAFIFSFSAVIIYILFDYGFLMNNVITENSLRLGKTLEGIFLTLAVVERFKFIENQGKIVIKDRSEKIEAQKETLQKINLELEKLSIIASETDNAIAIFDADKKIEWCNAAFERMYENNLNNIIKEHGSTIIEISNHDDIKIIIDECINNKKSVRYQTKRKLKSNKELWTQTTLTPYIDEQGNLIKLISIDTNITQIKEVQKELIASRDRAEESDKLKSAFLSNISHEIRTPLNAILGFSELLLLDKCDTPKRIKYLELVRNNGKHLLKLISDIIDISRIEAGEIKLDLFKGNINNLLIELYNHYNTELDTNLNKEVELRYHFDLSDPQSEVFADHHKIRQVFTNLLNNSVKFTLSGYIEMGYKMENKKFIFYVKDTGIGIEEDQQKIIFERFRQVEFGLSRKYGGAGLGLTLSKGLIEKMGGEIWIESEIGKGTAFYFSIPYDPISIGKREEKIIEYKTYDFKEKEILVVEDTVASKELIVEMLEETGAMITSVETGEEALELIRNKKFDVVLMDIRLPDINGYDVTRSIKKLDNSICIIAQTANAMDDEKRKCFEAGCDDYIAKPFNSNGLLDLIDKQLNKK